jgi:hypothetical protein
MRLDDLVQEAQEQMLADAARDAVAAAHDPVIGRGDADARIAAAFESARSAGGWDNPEARAVLAMLGVAYGEGDKVTCHGLPLIAPEAPAPWVACQSCGNRYGLRAIAGLAPSVATKGEGK